MWYLKKPKSVRILFHAVLWLLILILGAAYSGATNDTTETVISFLYLIVFGAEFVLIYLEIKKRKERKKAAEIEKNKPDNVRFYQVVPYNHENWLRIFGYKREFKGVIGVNMELINNDSLEIDFNGSELLIYHNQILIGRMTDEDLIDHLKKYWNDDNFEIVPLLYDVSFKSRTARIQINFYKQIQLYDNPKIKVVESKLLNVDESQRYIEQLKNGSYLKVYRDEENANRFFVTNLNEKTLGDVKKEVAKLVDEYFDSGYVIVRLKEVLNEVDHTDALVEFFFIQRGI